MKSAVLLKRLVGKDDTIAEQEMLQLPHPGPIQTASKKHPAPLLCAPRCDLEHSQTPGLTRQSEVVALPPTPHFIHLFTEHTFLNSCVCQALLSTETLE